MRHAPYSRSAEVYDVFYRARLDYPELALALHGMIQAKKPGAKTLLEVACGSGLYLEEFSRWYDVTGLDASPSMLEIAAERVPGVPLVEGDMADFDLGATFDAVACLFSSIAYVVTEDRLRAAIRCFARHLAPGGVLILEPWYGPDGWIDGHVAAESASNDDVAVARTSTSIRDGTTATMQWAFAVARPHGETATYVEEHVTGLFTKDQYAEALDAAGIVFDYDPEGLLDRGRYVGVKPVVV
jgi:SAM-dependent methyltransferase